MRKLLILRHAKSSWDDTSLNDFDRPLNERGRRDIPLMATALASQGLKPELIVSSPAARAKLTAELFKQAARWEAPLKFDQRIYEASAGSLFSIVLELSDEITICVLVGHNPGVEGLVRLLSGSIAFMPTAAVAVIEFDIDSWSAAEPGHGRLVEVIRPKELSQDMLTTRQN